MLHSTSNARAEVDLYAPVAILKAVFWITSKRFNWVGVADMYAWHPQSSLLLMRVK